MIEAVTTLISGGHGFFMGALGQKVLLDKFWPDIPHVVMVENNSYPDYKLDYLRQLGSEVRIVRAIRTRKARFAANRWPRTFTKLNLWNLTDFEHVLFMDADAYPYSTAVNGLYSAIEPDFLGATTFAKNTNRFRSGMLVVKPDSSRYADLLKYVMKNPVSIGAKLGDQGVLNCYCLQNNIDWIRVCYHWHTVVWPKRPKNVVIGHISPKPWQSDPRLPCGRKDGIHPYVDMWKRAILEIEDKYGRIPD